MALEVSVVIPTYNRREMVHEAAASVLAQQGVRLELIIVDDGSTDGTVDDLERLRLKHSSTDGLIRVLHHPTSRGVAAARNTGSNVAIAPLIAFLDSDDLWMPTKLRRQLDFMIANPTCVFAQTQEVWLRNGRRINPGLCHRKRPGDIFNAALRTCLISPSAVIIRTAALRSMGGFDEDLAAAEDYDLWLRMLAKHEVGLVDEPLVIRRAGHPGQLSATVEAIDRYRIIALLKLLASGDVSLARRAAASEVLAEKCRIYAQGLLRRGRVDAARLVIGVGRSRQGWGADPNGRAHEGLRAMRALVRDDARASTPIGSGTTAFL